MIPLPATSVPHDEIGVVLKRVATELAALTTVSEDLQDMFGTVMSVDSAEAGLHADALRSLQSLDLLTQTLDALSQFMLRVGEDADMAGCLDLKRALREVSLSGLAARLAGAREDADADMEFDLF